MALGTSAFHKALHQALWHLYEPDCLRDNPLAALLGIANRVDTFTRLQAILIEGIEAMEPGPEDPASAQRYEIYELLYFRYVQQMPQYQVAEQLSMSVRHLRRKEYAAIEALAAWLWEHHGLNGEGQEDPEQTTPSIGDVPDVDDELAWLRNVPVELPVNLYDAVSQVLDLVSCVAEEYDVKIETRLGTNLPGLAVHAVALNQMLLNLLTVMLHHARGGRIVLSAVRTDSDVCITVRGPLDATPDTAPGDEFNLNLAERLAQISQGQLCIQEAAGHLMAELTLPALGQRTVLVIDDNTDTLQLLCRYAAGSRYRLIVCSDPESALELAQQHAPQIIVLDVMMPRIDGWRLLGQFGEHPATRNTPVLVCTIVAQEEMAAALGAAGYLQKPIRQQQFLESLDALADRLAIESR